MFSDRILAFGRKFEGRLDPVQLQGALDYVSYNEASLALEILCEHICEYDISITNDEYAEVVSLIVEMKLHLDVGPFKFLKEQIS